MGLPKETKTAAVETILAILETSQRVCLWDLLNATQLTERDGRLAFWDAVQVHQTRNGVVWGVIKGHPFEYQRLDPAGIIGQAQRQDRAGRRKTARAEKKLVLVASGDGNDADRERASRAAARMAMNRTWKKT